MPTDTTTEQLGLAIRESGLFTPDQIKAAESVLTEGTAQAAADRLLELRVLTNYQYRKVRAGRVNDLLFGPYLILDKIGEGGMGKVYRAVQQRVGRMVALKTIRPHLMANKTVLKRYKREAQAAAALNHPNIVTLYDADEIDGRYFLSMEYVDGIDLSRMVKEFGKPPFRGLDCYQEVCEYVRQAALGLQHAHEHGLVHRDIKPGNLLVFGERALPDTGGKATVKILDMGLVRSVFDNDDVSRTELTRDGTVVGTPDYMAPEQAKNSSTVDPRADLYALGCTLYFLFRGQSLFPDGSPIDKLLRHQLDPPPDIRQTRPDLPPGVVNVIERLLRKKPEERIQTAAEVAHLLAPFSSTAAAVYAPAARPAPAVAVQPVPYAADPNAPSHPDHPVAGGGNGPVSPAAATMAPTATAAAHGPAAFAPTMAFHPAPAAPSPSRSGKVGTASNPAIRPLSQATPSPSARTPVRVQAPATPPPLPAAAPELPAFGDSQRMDGELIRVANRERANKKSVEKLNEPRPGPKIPVVWLAAAAAVFLGGLIAVAAIVLTRGGADKTPATPTSTPPTDPKPPPPPPGVSYPNLPASNLVVAPESKAVLTVFPKPFFAKVGTKLSRDSKTLAAVDTLADQTSFDPRLCERVTISLPPKPVPPAGFQPRPDNADFFKQPFVAIGEGPFLTEAWVRDLEKNKSLQKLTYPIPGVQPFFVPNGPSRFPNGPPSSRYAVGVLGTYAFGLEPSVLFFRDFSTITDQLKKQGFPRGLSAGLTNALQNPSEKNLPLAKFVADGDWAVAGLDKEKLSDFGVTVLTLTVRMNPNDFEVVLTLTGDRAKFPAFLTTYGTALGHLNESLKPLVDALSKGEQSYSRAGGEDVLKVTAKWTWPALMKAVDEVAVEAIRNEVESSRPKGANPFLPGGGAAVEPRPGALEGEQPKRRPGGFGEALEKLFRPKSERPGKPAEKPVTGTP